MSARRVLDTVTLIGIDDLDINRLRLAADLCLEYFDFADVKLLTSREAPEVPDIVPASPIRSTAEYSEFVVRRLHEHVDTPHALIIQYDGFILNPEAWTDEFLEYDYIGAPWLSGDAEYDSRYGTHPHLKGRWVVGNGGFSLRSKQLLGACAELAGGDVITEYHPEDVVLSVHHREVLESRGLTFAPVPLARHFSFEGGAGKHCWSGQLGFHGLRYTDISAWLKDRPDIEIDPNTNNIRRR